ncbi:MAG: TRAP transporter substrate-binding protein [Burkholderiales bacterium]|nr:MAG: TRAP transporter substrate-binding protein [Burkholderiales bacterium]
MSFRKLAIAAAVALAAAAAGATAARAQEVVLKFHTFMPPQSAVWLDMHVPWMDKVEKESGGRIRFERYPAMQLGGKPNNLYDQVKDGVADVTWVLPAWTAGRFPRVEVFELPFMMTNAEATSKALWEYVQTHAPDEFADVKVLALHVHGPGVIHTKSRQVETIGDLRGLKVRGPTRQITKLLASLGATPVGMPLPGIPDALSKGVIGGAVIPWEVVPAVKVNELARYHLEFAPEAGSLYTAVFIMAMNQARYDALPPDLKKVIDDNSGLETSGWLGMVQQGNDVKGRKTAVGNTIVTLDAKGAEPFRKASASVDDGWVKEMNGKGFDGQKLLDGARALVRKHTKP